MQRSPFLGIEFDDNREFYFPGDTIIGRVNRKSRIVCPDARIRISLHGRAKSKMVSGANSHQTYRGRFALLDGRRHSQVIFSGPLHIAADDREGQEWPFAMTIPTHCDPLTAQSFSEQDTFVPVHRDCSSAEELPPSMAATSSYSGRFEGFIEYFIRADLTTRGNSNMDMHTAIMPFQIRRCQAGPPIVDFKLRRVPCSRSLSSQRLIPGMENAELSKSQRMKKFFGTSSVPSMAFRFEVDSPSVIQLDSPEAMPFRLQATPDWDKSSEIIRNVPQMIKVTGLTLKIRQITEIRCEGTISTHEDQTDDTMEIHFDEPLRQTPVEFLCTDQCPRIDIGAAIGLRIGPYGAIGIKKGFINAGTCLYPDTVIYNIRVAHKMTWLLKLEVAGEEMELRANRGERPVIILAESDDREPFSAAPPPLVTERADSWIRPPDEDEAPPTFEEVQKEDMKAAQNSLAKLEIGQSSA